MTTSLSFTVSVARSRGVAPVMSMPTSRIASTATGLIWLAGSDPADRTSTLSPARWRSQPAAIWDRPALWTQTNKTMGLLTRALRWCRFVVNLASCGHSQQARDPLHAFADRPVVDPGPTSFAVDESGFAEDLQVVRDGRPGHVELWRDVADAHFVAGRRDDREQPQPHRVGKRLERRRTLGRLLGVEHRGGDGSAATTRGGRGECRLLFRHGSILTSIESRGKVGAD